MKQIQPELKTAALLVGSILTIGVVVNSCGGVKSNVAPPYQEVEKAPQEEPHPEREHEQEDPNLPDVPSHPYPNFKGQEFHGEKNFATLLNKYPKGLVEPTPWAGSWFPYLKNGIATRDVSPAGSPAGKYDAARGRTTFAQDWELKHHSSRVEKVEQWWGHCNGWCVAAALFKQPVESAMVNGIKFSVGDIKALLSEVGMGAISDFYGERFDDFDTIDSPKWWDTVPNQYFLVLTNYIGKLKRAVLIDRYTGNQVWNQPLAGYHLEYPKPSDYKGNTPQTPNVYRIVVNSQIWWVDDNVPADIISEEFTFEKANELGYIATRELSMEVWLDGPVVFDAHGKIVSSGDVIVARDREYIVGGAWLNGEGYDPNAWPDYMWIPYAVVKPTRLDQDYINPEVDMNWIKAHLLVPGGADDTSVTAGAIEAAPNPSPTGSPRPSGSPVPGASPQPTQPIEIPEVPSNPFPRNSPSSQPRTSPWRNWPRWIPPSWIPRTSAPAPLPSPEPGARGRP